ncbi:ATP-dependent helicase, partial [Paenibacillus polymyxa]|nr:ATP-dependent helicase [Paenibacillus polymyxa]
PSFKFRTKQDDDDASTDTEIKVRGLKEPSSKRVKDIIDSALTDLKAAILSDEKLVKALPGNFDPELINKGMIPKIIKITYPELSDEEVEE